MLKLSQVRPKYSLISRLDFSAFTPSSSIGLVGLARSATMLAATARGLQLRARARPQAVAGCYLPAKKRNTCLKQGPSTVQLGVDDGRARATARWMEHWARHGGT